MGTLLAGRPPIKIGGEWRTAGKGPHDDVEVRVAYCIVHAEELVFMMSGVRLSQFRVTPRKDSVLVMLKGERKGKKLVAWFSQPTWREAITLAATSMDSGYVDWLDDKPPPWKKR